MKKDVEQNEQMSWWRNAKFGMFVHWGLYSIPAGMWNGERVPGAGEWIMYKEQIPVDEYEELANRFNPVEFDAKEWVSLAEDAGMKYIVITAKHHDGFCMYQSDHTEYNIVDATPFDRDPMAELADACSGSEVRLGFYYSQTLDWHHPDGAGNDWDYDAEDKNFSEYFDGYVKPQVRELLNKYDPVSLMWFDIGTPSPEQARELRDVVRKENPETIINGRIDPPWDSGICDYESMGDNEIPDEKVEGDWQTPATMNDTWGYESYDHNWKSTGDLIHKLVEIASKGGNYLLNVGPTKEGWIPQPSVRRLKEMGEWLEKYGEGVYGTEPGPFVERAFGRSTRDDDKIYLHVQAWPSDGKLEVENLDEDIENAYLLNDPKNSLDFNVKDSELVIDVPETAPDSRDTVIALEVCDSA
ncbi:hypothetical protein AKJ41_05525 [candidate division MSBL1 archaeon SCGC-AAA259O05]|uniref:alpha-L-fucosidase n=1 Tax=candidate division MSBL1 archaeon SCGC-AAA259O05 TaxID=1698271 RepID=A0A133UYX3_9EURY|nr:hypothetical protein AKJ41_05525 [candidate division MSBL1 archaeon SCGC-AAA259O05]